MSEIPQIITADYPFPKEIDDGLFVEQLDESHELYRVGVCVADTSRLYNNPDVLRQAQSRTAARYWDFPDGESGYDPMIDTVLIKELEFTAGAVRSALIITFNVGPKVAPESLDISFGEVYVSQNKSYKEFSNFALYGKGGRFAKASYFIKDHLGYVAYGDHSGTSPAWRNSIDSKDGKVPNTSGQAWKKGSKMNEAYMVAANHLVGMQMKLEDRPAIYRVFDPEDEQYIDIVSANVAMYSRAPGPHRALRLDPYCRVTSPLRRLDDFVMNYQLYKRFLGKSPVSKDAADVGFAIRRLNQEIVASSPKEASRVSRQDILGRTAVLGRSSSSKLVS